MESSAGDPWAMTDGPGTTLVLDGRGLSLQELGPVLGAVPPRLALSEQAWERCRASREVINDVLREKRTVYGVNTGFGKLSNIRIEDDKLETLQRNLILSHATAVGEPLSVECSRLMLLLRIQALARGNSGVRCELLEQLLAFYNADLIPVIPQQGSVGASGDLAPLAHLAIALLGIGEVWYKGECKEARLALREAGLSPFALHAKEGLALINGTQCMTAIAVATWLHAVTLIKTADIACAMSVEALLGSEEPFRSDVQEVRGQAGQIRTASNLRKLLADSEIIRSHVDCEKVQDPYSLRCAPQVHGAVRDAIVFVGDVLVCEVNAATDNPLVFAPDRVISAGNFHGQPVAQAMDFLGISLASIANISERRIENMVNPDLSALPAFLAHDPGLESGLMIPQVVAASLASENKSLAHPASVDTIPTSANREDHVSMGVTAARHARDIAGNTAKVLGIELICAAQGIDYHASNRPGRGVAPAHAAVRERIQPLTSDRYLAPDLREAEKLVSSAKVVDAVEAVIGPLEA